MINIIVDSGCDLNNELKEKLDLQVVPLNLQVDDVNFVDDSNLDIDEYIKKMSSSSNIPKTSAPSPEKYMDTFKKEGSVFAITLSSKLSGSYNSALLAKQMFLEETNDKFIHIIDSLSASVGETVIAIKINEFIENNLSELEIVEKINKFIGEMKTYFILEKFDNLVKTGRMNPTIAKIASILSIKPICCGIDGEIALKDKARGYNKAVAKLIDIIKSDNVDFEERTLAISHVKCLEKAIAFKDEIKKKINFKDIIITEASGLCSTYANKDGIIVSF